MIINIYRSGQLIDKKTVKRLPTVGEPYDNCCEQLEVAAIVEEEHRIKVIVWDPTNEDWNTAGLPSSGD